MAYVGTPVKIEDREQSTGLTAVKVKNTFLCFRNRHGRAIG